MFPSVGGQCHNSTAPTVLSIMTATFSSLFLLITVPSNLLVCLAVIIDPLKELRTQFNCFTFNLALADLTVGGITESVFVYYHVKESQDSEFGNNVDPVMQKVIHTSFFITAVASALTLTTLALERYLAVTSPLYYRQFFNVSFAIKLSIIIWVISISVGTMNIYLNYYLQCFIIINTLLVFVGITVCFACYKIRATLKKESLRLADMGVSVSLDVHEQRQKSLTKTFELMIAALICCYVPVTIMIYYMSLCKDCSCDAVQWCRDAFIWLVLLNSVVNPFIYAYRNHSFRDAVKIIVKCRGTNHQRTYEQFHQ